MKEPTIKPIPPLDCQGRGTACNAVEGPGQAVAQAPEPIRDWILVPVVPTDEMLKAGVQQIDWERASPTTVLPDMTVVPSGDHDRLITTDGEVNLSACHIVNGEPCGTSIGQDLRDAWGAMLQERPTDPGLLVQLVDARQDVLRIQAEIALIEMGQRFQHYERLRGTEEWFYSRARNLADSLMAHKTEGEQGQ